MNVLKLLSDWVRKIREITRSQNKAKQLNFSGMRASKEGRNIIDFEGQLHHNDTSPHSKTASEYQLNEIRKSSQKRRPRNTTFDAHNGGSYSNYEELAAVAEVARNPGDGQQREDEMKLQDQIELTPYEAGKAGYTGKRPQIAAAEAGMVLVAYPTEPETDTLHHLGMPPEQDGDRLTPLSAILEGPQTSSGSFENPSVTNARQHLGLPPEQDGDRLTPLNAFLERAQSSSVSFENSTVTSARQEFSEDNYLVPIEDESKRSEASASPKPIQIYEPNG